MPFSFKKKKKRQTFFVPWSGTCLLWQVLNIPHSQLPTAIPYANPTNMCQGIKMFDICYRRIFYVLGYQGKYIRAIYTDFSPCQSFTYQRINDFPRVKYFETCIISYPMLVPYFLQIYHHW